MKNRLFLTWCFLIPLSLAAQSRTSKPLSLSLFNNATLFPPASFTAIFNQPLHPGLAAGYEFGWKQKEYSKWFQDVSVAFFSHRYAYRALLIYSRAGYRRCLGHLTVEGSLHSGYMHMFLVTDRLVKQEDGSYEARKGFGKPQFIAGAGAGIGYLLGGKESGRRLFLNYDVRLQMPFVKSYVPLLPNGIVSLGIQMSIK